MKFKEWLEKAKYKTWFGELCGNTFSLTLALAFISFLNIATEGTLIAIAATSFWWSFKARWNPFRSGFFPAFISSTLLQIIYFASGTDMMPVNVMITMFIGNLILISALSGIFSWFGTWIRNRKIQKTEQAKKDLEEKTSVFSDNLKRLALVTLFFYINMFIVIPTLAKVSAESTGTQISSDEFIENYDPENTYTTKSKIPDVKPKRRVPLESPYGNITSTELEQLEAYCQTNGCDLTTVASQLSQMRLKGVVSMDMYIGMLDKVYAPKPVVQWQNTLLIPKVVKSLKNTAKGKKAVPVKVTKKADNRPWYQKAWDGAKRFGEEIDNKLIYEPTKFIKEHPWQAAGMAVVGIGLVVAAVVSAPVAAALGVAAVIGAGIASFGLAKAYNDGGWNGVANNVFSKPTISMWKSGDIGGAAGRGTVELLGKALEIAPIVEAPKAAVAVVNGVKALPAAIKAAPQVISNTVSAVKAASEMRVGIGVVIEADVLNSGGVKIVKNLAKNAGDNIKAINPFIKDLPQNPGALAVINSSGKEVVAAGKTGVSESIIAEKKAGEIAGKITKEEINHTPLTDADKTRLQNDIWIAKTKGPNRGIVVDSNKIPSSSSQASINGSLPKPGPNMEDVTLNQIKQQQRLNTGSHPMDHVGKTTSDLELQIAPRSVGGREKISASSFDSEEEYVSQVNKSLKNNYKEIESWLKNPNKNRIEIFTNNQTNYLGKIVEQVPKNNSTAIGRNPLFVLEKNADGKGYHILTNYIKQ